MNFQAYLNLLVTAWINPLPMLQPTQWVREWTLTRWLMERPPTYQYTSKPGNE